MDVYGHLFDDRPDEVADVLGRARNASSEAAKEAGKAGDAVAAARNPVATVMPRGGVVDLATTKGKS